MATPYHRASALLILASSAASAQTYSLDYVTDTFCSNLGGLNNVGNSVYLGSAPCRVRLTDGYSTSGSVWANAPFDATAVDSISTFFEFRMSGGSLEGSGLTFTLQPVGTAALGGAGGNLGYQGITPSMAIEFDAAMSYGNGDIDDNHIGFNVDGSTTSLQVVSAPMDMSDGSSVFVWIDFDLQAQTAAVYTSSTNSKPGFPTTTFTGVDIARLGGAVHPGFTAGSWGYFDYYYYYAWILSDRQSVRQWSFEAASNDSDGDGVPDAADQCPGFDDSLDGDGDGTPDGCDLCPNDFLNDSDGDGTCDSADICPGSPDSVDGDGDGIPDGCDACPLDFLGDSDGDGVCDSADVCAGFADTADGDGDGIPDGCDACPTDFTNDSDGDGVCDGADTCPGADDLLDSDLDGTPDCLDACPFDATGDSDGDGVCDSVDVCPGEDDTVDGDLDGTPDCADPCPLDSLDDSDGDGSCDSVDLCPGSDDAVDPDGDGVPSGCDPCPSDFYDDSDGDGSCDISDICPGQNDFVNTDGDLAPDCLDPCPLDYADDSDGDGSCDSVDICPGQDDTPDSDGDTIPDCLDACPNDPGGDTDGDTVCDYLDVCPGFDDLLDSDGDGIPNGCDSCLGGTADGDIDGIPDDCDLCQGYDDAIDTDSDGNPDGCDPCPFDAFEGDSDGDGFISCQECDDSDALVFPSAPGELPADGVDTDCDGRELCYEDLDGDQYGGVDGILVEVYGTDCVAGGASDNTDDCDDQDASVYPGAIEVGGNGIDEDCDGVDAESEEAGTDTDTDTGTEVPDNSDRGWTSPEASNTSSEGVAPGAVGCGCDSAPGSLGWVWGGLALLGLRR